MNFNDLDGQLKTLEARLYGIDHRPCGAIACIHHQFNRFDSRQINITAQMV